LPGHVQGQKLAEVGYRMDMLVERELVIEVKAVETIAPFIGRNYCRTCGIQDIASACSSTSTRSC
jgi:hypothetical protein